MTWKQCVQASGFNSRNKFSFVNAAASMYIRSYFNPGYHAGCILFVGLVSANLPKMALGSVLGESLGEELRSLCSPTFW